jgi:hypothetical protein
MARCQPTWGHEGNLPARTQIQILRMPGLLSGAMESASCWPPFVSLCPSLCLLWAALTRLAGLAIEP